MMGHCETTMRASGVRDVNGVARVTQGIVGSIGEAV